jgi:ribose 5-phosphate isomerase B
LAIPNEMPGHSECGISSSKQNSVCSKITIFCNTSILLVNKIKNGKKLVNTPKTGKNKIAIGSDHAGYELKEALKKYLNEIGRPFADYGTFSLESTDYPDWGSKVAEAVASSEHERGILICGAGIGMSIVANRYPGVRAALCTSEYLAEICRRHNDANIIVMGGRTTPEVIAKRMLKIWLETPFEGGRHADRIEKLNCLQSQNTTQSND